MTPEQEETEFYQMEKVYLQLRGCIWFLTKEELNRLKELIDIELGSRHE